jgi:hypothetical protein
VFTGGTNHVSNNNSQAGLKHIVNFVQTNRHTNIILVRVSPDWPCVNYEVETFNRKLMELVKPFKNDKVVKADLEREFYTNHGQHMKSMGKEKVAVQTAQAVTIILQEPISLYWKTDQEDKGSQSPREENTFIQEDLKATALDRKQLHLTASVV